MIANLLFQIFILFLPTQLALHFWPDFAFVHGIRVDYFAPAIYFTDILWIFVLVFWLIERKFKISKPIFWHETLVILILAILNIAFSSIPALSLYKWARVFMLLSVYLYVKNQKDAIRLIKLPLCISLLFTLFLSVLQIINHGSLQGIFYFFGERSFSANTPGIALVNIFGREVLRPYATFPHPNALAGFALVSFFLLLKYSGLLAKIGLASSFFLIIISFSQNAWIALPVSLMLFSVLNRLKKLRSKFLICAVVASFFLTLPAIMFPSGISREIVERATLNTLAGKAIAMNPLLGAGLGVFPSLVPSYSFFDKTIWWLQPVHNIFLLVASEVGLLGLLAFTYFLIKNIRKANLLLVIAIVLTGLFDHYWLTINQTGILMFLVIGL